jgi:preprotein translocase subunit YajC
MLPIDFAAVPVLATVFGPILAQAAPAPVGGGGMSDLMVTMVPLLAMFGIMYFLVLRPQQQKMRDHQAMVDAVKQGDTVTTNGGLIGKVVQVDTTELKLEIADNVKVRVARGMIADVKTKDAGKKA